MCAERCASDAALDAIDIEGVGVAATTRDIDGQAPVLTPACSDPQLKGQTSNERRQSKGDGVRLPRRPRDDDMVVAPTIAWRAAIPFKMKFRLPAGPLHAYDAWGEWSLRLGYQKLTPSPGAPAFIANGATTGWVSSSILIEVSATATPRLRCYDSRTFRKSTGRPSPPGAKQRLAAPASTAASSSRLVKLAFACLSRPVVNGAMALPYIWSAISAGRGSPWGAARYGADDAARAERLCFRTGKHCPGSNLRRAPFVIFYNHPARTSYRLLLSCGSRLTRALCCFFASSARRRLRVPRPLSSCRPHRRRRRRRPRAAPAAPRPRRPGTPRPARQPVSAAKSAGSR